MTVVPGVQWTVPSTHAVGESAHDTPKVNTITVPSLSHLSDSNRRQLAYKASTLARLS